MIFKRIAFTNFSVFRGRQLLDLTKTTPEKPIALIGGLNGSGKTSMIEGIVLGLYGLEGWRWWFRQGSGRAREYHEHIAAALNHRAKHDGEIRLAVDFEIDPGDGSTVFIRRRWWVDGDTVEEDLEVQRDRTPVPYRGLPEDRLAFLQTHIDALLPPEVSPFFFFDGERVREYARHASPDRLRDGVDRLLRLDPVNGLIKHLGQMSSQLDHADLKPLIEREALLAKQCDDLDATIEITEVAINSFAAEREALDTARRELRESAERQFGGIKDQIESLEQEFTELGQQIRGESTLLGHDLGGPLALALCLPLVRRLDSAVRRVAAHRRANERARSTIIHVERLESLIAELGKAHTANTPEIPEALTAALASYREQARSGQPLDPEAQLVDGFTAREVEELKRRGEHAEQLDRRALRQRARDLDAATADRTDLRKRMDQIRRGTAQMDYVGRIDDLGRRAGELEGRHAELVLYVEGLEEERGALGLELSEVRAELRRQRERHARGGVILRTRDAVEEIRQTLRRDQLVRLADQLKYTSGELARKQQLFSRMVLDIDACELRLLDSLGHEVQMGKLSSGEAQVVALSLLWALSRAVSTDLPCVLDTPLGRLDSAHRGRMAATYFKEAGSQVIILSTDEEITGPYLELLHAHVGVSFKLVHNEASESSGFVPGYFEAKAA